MLAPDLRRAALGSALALVLLLAPRSARSQEGTVPPMGLAVTASLAGGGELGLDEGEDAGVGEVEGTLGYELEQIGLTLELGLAFGLAPDTHLAVRPGLRFGPERLPVQLRVALDAANARETGLQWRWLLVGVAGEVRLTSVLGLFAEVDTGAPLSSDAGLPLLFRVGASFRL